MNKATKHIRIFLIFVFSFNLVAMLDLGFETQKFPFFAIVCIMFTNIGISILFPREIREDQEEEYKKENIKQIFIEALNTDGNHHKQWYLEALAYQLGIDLSQIDYDKGIAP